MAEFIRPKFKWKLDTPDKVDHFLTVLRRQLLKGGGEVVDWRQGTDTTRNFETGWIERQLNGTATLLLEFKGGYREGKAPPVLPTTGTVRKAETLLTATARKAVRKELGEVARGAAREAVDEIWNTPVTYLK